MVNQTIQRTRQRALVKHVVMAASGRHVRQRGRLACALAWQPCVEDVGTLWWGCQLVGAKCAITNEYMTSCPI